MDFFSTKSSVESAKKEKIAAFFQEVISDDFKPSFTYANETRQEKVLGFFSEVYSGEDKQNYDHHKKVLTSDENTKEIIKKALAQAGLSDVREMYKTLVKIQETKNEYIKSRQSTNKALELKPVVLKYSFVSTSSKPTNEKEKECFDGT